MPRKTNTRKANRTILLVVEGQTEKEYFSELKNSEKLLSVTIIPKVASHSSVSNILESAIRESDDKIYDSIWCVFDRDTEVAKKAKALEFKAVKKGIKIADSLPTFEVWFLLHYTIPKSNYLDQDKLIDELKRYIPDYIKGKRMKAYSLLKSKLGTAMNNAKDLESKEYETYCNIYKIFEDIGLKE